MLCYRYSRDVIEIIHDTFEWLRLNRRPLVMAMVPLVALCVAATFIFAYDVFGVGRESEEVLYSSALGEQGYSILDLLSLLLPYALFFESLNMQAFAVYLGLTLATAILVVPLIRQYFYYRKSLAFMTWKKLTLAVEKNIARALASAALLTAMCAIAMLGPILLTLAALWLFMSIFPCVMMSQPWSIVTKGIFRMMQDIFMSIFFFCIVQALPVFCLTILYVAMYFLANVLPGGLDNLVQFDQALMAAMTFMMCLSYCASLVVLMVNMIVIHGTRYYNPIFQ